MMGRNLSKILSQLAILCTVAGLLAITQQSYGKDKEKLTPEEKIEKALQQPTSFEFVKTPLPEVAACLGKMHGINILLDWRAFSVEGLDPETPINFSLKHPVTFRSALKWILRDLDLTYMIHDEVLIITTTAAAQEKLEIKIYLVSEFTGNCTKKLKKFADIITRYVAPESWSEVGGEGGISTFAIKDKNALIVSQTREVHEDIEVFLYKLRAVAGLSAIARQSYGKDKEKLTPGEKLEKALQHPTSIEFVKTPLSEVATCFEKKHGINIALDRRGFADEGLDPETPVTLILKHPVPFRSALKWTLRDLYLDYVVIDEVIIIVSGCAERLETKFYEVSEFVGNRADKLNTFAKFIETCIAPESWIKVGGEGEVSTFTIKDKSVLIVSQAREVHYDIGAFLNKLRSVVGLSAIVRHSCGKDEENLTPEEKIEKTLNQPTSFEFVETPLSEVATYLGKMHGINILLDRRMLSDEGHDPEAPITFSLKRPVTFRSALNVILRDLDLDCVVEDEVIVITLACAQERLETRIYEVSEFVGNRADKLKTFAKDIETRIAPESWFEVGGEGSIFCITIRDKSVLVISQTYAIHRKLDALLDKLRAVANR